MPSATGLKLTKARLQLTDAEEDRQPAPEPLGFAALDALSRDPALTGFFVVRARPSVVDALCRHVERRARAAGRTVVSAWGRPFDEGWREIAHRCGIADGDPSRVVRRMRAAVGSGLALVGDDATCWGRAVALELAHSASTAASGQYVVFSENFELPPGATEIRLAMKLSRADVALWGEAIVNEASGGLPAALDRVEALDAWWLAARETPVDAQPPSIALPPEACRLLGRCALAGRALTVAEILALGPRHVLDALHARALLARVGEDRYAPANPFTHATDANDCIVVAGLLVALEDPWARVRAAELYANALELDLAEEAVKEALILAPSVSARNDFWHRWTHALAAGPKEGSIDRFLNAAELALHLGDVACAADFARAAAARGGERLDVMLMLGRSALARGDLTTADLALRRVVENESSGTERCRALAELAEAQYQRGAFEPSRYYAESALATTSDPHLELLAKNVLGKLLLANGAVLEAEQHFDRLASAAACLGDVVMELRARINRGVALYLAGNNEEARAVLTVALADAERASELRAVAYAVSNLATIASLEQKYAEALRFSERAIDARLQLGAGNGLPLDITNLAELHVAAGALDEAEQTIAFGRQACNEVGGDAGTLLFARVEARIHFCRGDTLAASVANARAKRAASDCNYGTHLSECHVLDARIALEHGDVSRARGALALASGELSSSTTRAEILVVQAACARAAGEAFEALALEARARAIDVKDRELEREASTMLFHAAKARGDADSARTQLDAALAIRNRIAAGVPESLRAGYLRRRALAELSALESQEIRPVLPAEAPIARRSESIEPSPSTRPSLGATGFGIVVGTDPAMRALRAAVAKVGPTDTTVLIQGESGTGKELLADALHEASTRSTRQIVKVNCGALVETLLLAELFGHERGAFTGAVARRRGRFELADGGTLFLDEIGDISAASQVALLRVLQDRTFERVGGITPITVDVRIVCATHRDLAAMVATGRFRRDLYYRLAGVVLDVPPLRTRVGDLPELASALLLRIAHEQGATPKRLSMRALDRLSRHDWPGNVRELENVLRAAVVFADDDEIDVDKVLGRVPTGSDLRQPGRQAWADPERDVAIACPSSDDSGDAHAGLGRGKSLADIKRTIERDCIARALDETNGNITRAAALLGMKRPRLSQLVKQHRLMGGRRA